MSQGTNPDFGDFWRDLLRRWEETSNAFGSDAMKTAEFSQAMNQANNFSMAAQNLFAESFSKYLAAMNLPTRADVTGLAERLHAIEGRIEEIRLMLSDMQLPQAPSGDRIKPTRNRRPPSDGGAAPSGQP